MTKLNVARYLGASGDPTTGKVTIGFQTEDGSQISLVLDVLTANTLMPPLHQVTLKLADQLAE